ncbi:hypothetical protein D5R40_29480 [Okeania hirsuta]|uniref:Uncharacterized protein n=1 Tax=Okeania hirsuta TaxID=1458930 RepID=A0A3N6P0N7_9CYAN|nr:hypothetical protein D5R40_29480 [Okeania hirsuta]
MLESLPGESQYDWSDDSNFGFRAAELEADAEACRYWSLAYWPTCSFLCFFLSHACSIEKAGGLSPVNVLGSLLSGS